VVICHHPLKWLQDSVDARRYVRSRARVFMSGHEHKPSLQIETIENGQDLMTLEAGATVPPKAENGYTYTYNLLTFDWDADGDKLVVEVIPRAWSEENKRFEADDVRLGGRKPRNSLASPNFRRGAPVPQSKPMAEPAFRADAVVEPIEPSPSDQISQPQTPTAEASMNDDFQLVLLRFFRDLTATQRLRVLVELKALPSDWTENLTLMMERKVVDRLVKAGRLPELATSVERVQNEDNETSGKKP
jgi:hypothetical protein